MTEIVIASKIICDEETKKRTETSKKATKSDYAAARTRDLEPPVFVWPILATVVVPPTPHAGCSALCAISQKDKRHFCGC